MEFSPGNPVVQLCIQGIALEEQGKYGEALEIFSRAWSAASDDFEKYLAAWFLSRRQAKPSEKLRWLETALQLALAVNQPGTLSALSTLYSAMAKCYEEMGEQNKALDFDRLAGSVKNVVDDVGPFYHGTRANLQIGDLPVAGKTSNYQQELVMNHIYFTGIPNGAGLAASLAKGEGEERVYVVEPTGDFENDPNVTDKKFPGNPTRSYRTISPLKIVGELSDWRRQTDQQREEWKKKLAESAGKIIN